MIGTWKGEGNKLNGNGGRWKHIKGAGRREGEKGKKGTGRGKKKGKRKQKESY